MKILVYSMIFHPDHSGIARYSTDFAVYAAENDHNVEVITGYSFYPKWKKRKEDKYKLFSTEYWKGIKILRGYLYVPSNPNTLKRILQELSFLFFSSINFLRAKKPDITVVFTTPISIGWVAALINKINKSTLVINVQDFQLEAASSLGMMLKGNIFFKLLAKAEAYSYKNADYVTSISNSMCDLLTNSKSLPKEKVLLWPNWIDENEVKLDKNEKGLFRAKNNISADAFVIAYAGNIGLKQGLEVFVDLADRFADKKDLVFLLIGEGAGLGAVKKYKSDRNVTNLQILPFLNEKGYIEFLNDIDVFFMSQKKTDFDVYFPSKLLGLMAAGKTLVLSADKDSELYKTINSNVLGFVSDYNDIEALVSSIEQILNDKNSTAEIQKRAEAYVSTFYRDIVLSTLLNKIQPKIINK